MTEDEDKGELRERLDTAREEGRETARKLEEGREVEVRGESLAVRPFVAIAIFVAAFTVLYLVTWTLLGGIGLAVGAFTGFFAGAFAVKLYADRAAA